MSGDAEAAGDLDGHGQRVEPLAQSVVVEAHHAIGIVHPSDARLAVHGPEEEETTMHSLCTQPHKAPYVAGR